VRLFTLTGKQLLLLKQLHDIAPWSTDAKKRGERMKEALLRKIYA